VYLLLALRSTLYTECGVLIWNYVVFIFGIQWLEVVWNEDLLVRELVV
jgi:hypothetical protein